MTQPFWFSTILSSSITAKGVQKRIKRIKYLHDSNGEYSDAARDFHKLLEIFQKVSRNFLKRRSKVAQKRIKSDVQEISTIEWQELKNRFPSFVIHK